MREIQFLQIYTGHTTLESKRNYGRSLTFKYEKPSSSTIFGDFNVVRRAKERFNSEFCAASAFYFNEFIRLAEFHDFTMGGEVYTYMSRVSAKLSKLDIFLACTNFVAAFPSLVVTAHPRELSDHCPVTLITAFADYGPPPFKLFNSWLLQDGFDVTVKKAWEDFGDMETLMRIWLLRSDS